MNHLPSGTPLFHKRHLDFKEISSKFTNNINDTGGKLIEIYIDRGGTGSVN
jgi:hypothetical protein